MIPDEIEEWAWEEALRWFPAKDLTTELIARAIQLAVRNEREDCALICEKRKELYSQYAMGFPQLALSEAASSIRSRS